MTPRERLEAFWSGQKPDRIPYTLYIHEFRNYKNDPAWGPIFAAGLRVTYGANAVREVMQGVEVISQPRTEGGRNFVRNVMRTPVGEIWQDTENGWVQQHWLKTAEDYRVMRYIVEHTRLEPNYEELYQLERTVGDHGIVHPCVGGRTPMQTILVDFVGLENFGFHLIDLEEEVLALYEALLKSFRRRVAIAAEGPGRYIAVLENFTAETMGPARFQQFHVPVYRECFPVLQQSGKIVGTHYDGKLSCCKDIIATLPTDLIESLTPPPEGDMTLAECRAAWPTKLFWSNINVSTYRLPPKELRKTVLDAIAAAAPDGRRLAFEISEHMPENWKESIPVVLAAIEEAKI